IQGENGSPFKIRTPMWVNQDGSLQMNADLENGDIGHLLVGSREKCIDAARLATFEALSSLGSSKLALALVFADVSWQMLLEGQSGVEISAIREVLGPNIPIAGGYTFGQISRDKQSNKIDLLNQHIEVVLIGE
ncbi:MAG: FIST C-terminal domain-containing protein, partial [Chloroflexota bacterium]